MATTTAAAAKAKAAAAEEARWRPHAEVEGATTRAQEIGAALLDAEAEVTRLRTALAAARVAETEARRRARAADAAANAAHAAYARLAPEGE